jgi:glycosyltransferase involved in cell wall biosynthesis
MSDPLVSIIIPVYNAEQYIEASILSAINQTWLNKEIIIVNDGSTDNSLNIAHKYANSQVKIFTQTKQGASAARNKGLQHAQGEFIQFLDADDLLHINKIKEQMDKLNNSPGYTALGPVSHFTNGTDPQKTLPKASEFAVTDPLYFLQRMYGGKLIEAGYEGMIQPNAWLTPRAIIEKAGEWNTTLTLDDDGEFFCRVVLASKKIMYVPDAISYYRKYNTATSLSGAKNNEALKSALLSNQLKFQHLKKASNDEKTNIALAKLFLEYAVSTYPAHKELYREAFKKLKELPEINYVPTIGGPLIEFIKEKLGWRAAKQLQCFFKKFNIILNR